MPPRYESVGLVLFDCSKPALREQSVPPGLWLDLALIQAFSLAGRLLLEGHEPQQYTIFCTFVSITWHLDLAHK